MTAALGAAVGLIGLATLPALLPLDKAAPLAAAGAWLSAVAARAILVLILALVVMFYAPAPLIGAIGHWCVTVPLPFAGLEFAATGHLLAQVVVVTPTVIATASLCLALAGAWREARHVRRRLESDLLWIAPGDAAVIAGDGVFVATAGISKPRLVLSTGALVTLDDDELAASLAHERGHIRRGHRFVLLASDVLMGLARFVPRARSARPEIVYHLERDADQWALRRNHDPVVLARAICKAALTPAAAPALTGLATGRTVRRVETLLRADRGLAPRRQAITGMSVGLALTCLLALSTLPATAAAGVHEWRHHQPERHCIE